MVFHIKSLDLASLHLNKKNVTHFFISLDGLFLRSGPPPLSNSSFSINSPLNKTSNASAMKRSSSSINSSRPGSACSLPSRTTPLSGRHPTIKKPIARRSTGVTSLQPNTRDRAASFGATQCTLPSKNLAIATIVRRKSSTGVSATSSIGIMPFSNLLSVKNGPFRESALTCCISFCTFTIPYPYFYVY